MPQPLNSLPKDTAFDVYRHLTQHTAQAIFIMDLEAPETVYYNPACWKLWDLGQQNDNKGLNFIIRTVHAEDREYVVEKVRKNLRGEESVNLEFRIISHDELNETVKWVNLALYILDDNKGKNRFWESQTILPKKRNMNSIFSSIIPKRIPFLTYCPTT